MFCCCLRFDLYMTNRVVYKPFCTNPKTLLARTLAARTLVRNICSQSKLSKQLACQSRSDRIIPQFKFILSFCFGSKLLTDNGQTPKRQHKQKGQPAYSLPALLPLLCRSPASLPSSATSLNLLFGDSGVKSTVSNKQQQALTSKS